MKIKLEIIYSNVVTIHISKSYQLLIIFTICFLGTVKNLEANTDTLVTKFPQEFYNAIKSKNDFYSDAFKSSLPSLIGFAATILTIIFTYRQTKKQLEQSQNTFLTIHRTTQENHLVEILSKYISHFDLKNADIINKIKRGESISGEQSVLENSLRIILNSDNDGGIDIIYSIDKYRNKKIDNAKEWIEELINLSSKLITTKISKNEFKF